MNGIIPSGIMARNEALQVSNVSNWFIQHKSSTPAVGQHDDGVICMFELTRSHVKIDKYHTMIMFSDSLYMPDFSEIKYGDKKYYSGRDLISKLLEETPVNYTKTPAFYKPDYPHLADYYQSDEIKVNIERGKVNNGVLDKLSIGEVSNSLYHSVFTGYGPDKALESIYNMQQIALGYIFHYGFTIGINDLLISKEARRKIHEAEASIINEANLVTDRLNRGEIIAPIGKTVEEFFEELQLDALSPGDDFIEPILAEINPDTNNLFKLIMSGSKGKVSHMEHMVSAIGSVTINGRRPAMKFSFKRTSPYSMRFETDPSANGYIKNSYISGMTSEEYFYNSMRSRFSLITKALTTSVTGEQNRKSIKNLESMIINNLRMCLKLHNVIQFIYGEDNTDPRFVVPVPFKSVLISNDDFKQQFHIKSGNKDVQKQFDKLFVIITENRKKYRDIYLNIEDINVKELLSATRFLPINAENIIKDILYEFGEQKPSDNEQSEMLSKLFDINEQLTYVLMNEIQEQRKAKIPEIQHKSSWLLRMHIMETFGAYIPKLSVQLFDIIVQRVRIKYLTSLIDYGTSVGVIAAQSFSEPLTQYMLDSHHRSTSGGTSTSVMTKAKEVLSAKPVDKLVDPMALLPLKGDIAKDKNKAQELANHLEMLPFKDFIVYWQIFFEKYKEPIHPQYREEVNMIREFEKYNPSLKAPNDLIKWCIRFQLDKTSMILKNMSLETIINKLRMLFPDLFIVYTPENAKNIIVRVYIRNTHFRNRVSLDDILELKTQLLNSIIRGVSSITEAFPDTLIRTEVKPDGSLGRLDDTYCIRTHGTNLSDLMKIKHIDAYRVQSDAIDEIYNLFGIEAARHKIMSELREFVADVRLTHLMSYADEMTYIGRVTSIEKSGLSTREVNNILLRIGSAAPIQVIEEASVNSIEDEITGVTAPILLGGIPEIGTLYNGFYINDKFVKENTVNPDDIIDSLGY